MKLVIAVVLCVLVMIPSLSMANGKCELPKGCQYMDSEFSTGGGNKASYIMEVTCKMPNGRLVKYLSWELSAGGLLGMGRLTAPNKIEFVKGYKDKLECDY